MRGWAGSISDQRMPPDAQVGRCPSGPAAQLGAASRAGDVRLGRDELNGVRIAR
jgi:hypothetical protein